MNEDNTTNHTNGSGQTPQEPAKVGPEWNIPGPPQETTLPDANQPAADYARQQLSQAYAQQPSAPYNPYRPQETAYNLPAASPSPETQNTQDNPSEATQPQQAAAQPAVTSTNGYHQTPYSPEVQQQSVHGSVEQPERSVSEIKQQLLGTVRSRAENKTVSRWKPALTAIAVGLAFLFVSYNEVAIAQIRQYVSPGSSLTTPVIVDPTAEINIGNEPRIIIPKINVDVPVVYDEKTYDEGRIQAALERGVVHYGETALPGQVGNNVIVGHSSNNFFNGGKYKFAFVLLDRLKKDDTFILHYKGTRYVYKVFNKQIISPDDFSLIQPTDRPVTTLITCTPPGTAWRRLVVQAEQISPSVEDAKKANTKLPTDFDTPVPGAAPSFWDRVWDIF